MQLEILCKKNVLQKVLSENINFIKKELFTTILNRNKAELLQDWIVPEINCNTNAAGRNNQNSSPKKYILETSEDEDVQPSKRKTARC